MWPIWPIIWGACRHFSVCHKAEMNSSYIKTPMYKISHFQHKNYRGSANIHISGNPDLSIRCLWSSYLPVIYILLYPCHLMTTLSTIILPFYNNQIRACSKYLIEYFNILVVLGTPWLEHKNKSKTSTKILASYILVLFRYMVF